MTRKYKTSYKTHRNSSRFHVTFDAATIASQIEEACTICGGKIEESPMMRGVCYGCYQSLVQSPEAMTAHLNHAACLLAEVMRDCDNCKFQPDDSGLPLLALSDTVAIAITPKVARFMDAPEVAPWDEIEDIIIVTKLPPAKINTLQGLAEARDKSFNAHYYGNNGLPYFKHQNGGK